jgi:sugar phosphate permease
MFKEIRDEARARRDLALAQDRVQTLKHALAAGEKVDDQLRQAEIELGLLSERFPHGNNLSFCIFGVLVTLSAIAVRLFAASAVLIELWGSPDHPYLQQYRGTAASIWQACQVLSSSIAGLIGLVALLGVVWIAQSRMERESARVFLQALIVADLVFKATLIVSFFRLLSMPLG